METLYNVELKCWACKAVHTVEKLEVKIRPWFALCGKCGAMLTFENITMKGERV